MSDYLVRGRFGTPVNPVEVGMEWGRDGFSCDQFRDPPGKEWADFVHRTDEVLTVVKGRLELEIDGQRITVDEGDEAYIPGGTRHTVRNVHHRETRWLYGYGRAQRSRAAAPCAMARDSID